VHPAPDLPADAVAIRRLRLRARTGGEARVRQALAAATWPLPPAGAWVILRAVRAQVSGSANTPGGLGAAAARAVAVEIAAAVDLASPGAAAANAVYATDRVTLVALLARDLATGQAAARWYWRAWSALLARPAGGAIAELLGERPADLAAITARLADLGALAPVWRRLAPDDALAVLGRLAEALRLALPPPPVVGAATGAPTGGVLPSAPPAAPPSALVRRWRGVLADWPATDPRRHLAAVLVTLEWRPLWLTGLEHGEGPGAGSQTAGQAARLATVGAVLAGAGPAADADPRHPARAGNTGQATDPFDGPPPAPDAWPRTPTTSGRLVPGAANPAGADAGELARPRSPVPGLHVLAPLPPGAGPAGPFNPAAGADPAAGRAADSGSATTDSGAASGLTDAAASARSVPTVAKAGADLWRLRVAAAGGAGGGRHGSMPPAADNAANAATGSASGDAPVARHAAAAAGAPDALSSSVAVAPSVGLGAEAGVNVAWDCVTDEGGLFYLINFLARPEAQALLRGAGAGDRFAGDGWGWLLALGHGLGLAPTGALARFLAERSAATDPERWADATLRPLITALDALGARLYGRPVPEDVPDPVHDSSGQTGGPVAMGAAPTRTASLARPRRPPDQPAPDVASTSEPGLWSPQLLAVPAVVRHTPSHLDVIYPLAAVRLAVRQVALDVNPGWVPWLGRVVTLHYRDPWPGGGP
jgi:hypothetical protein